MGYNNYIIIELTILYINVCVYMLHDAIQGTTTMISCESGTLTPYVVNAGQGENKVSPQKLYTDITYMSVRVRDEPFIQRPLRTRVLNNSIQPGEV